MLIRKPWMIKLKKNNEAAANTSSTPEQFQGNGSSTSIIIEFKFCFHTNWNKINNIEHSFENLKKDQVTIQQIEIKLKLFRFYEDSFKINEKRVTYFTGLANVSTLSKVFNCIKTKIYGNCVLSPFRQMILYITGV